MQTIPKVFTAVRRALGEPTFSFDAPIKPRPKPSIKMAKGGRVKYYPKPYRDWRTQMSRWLADCYSEAARLDGPVAVLMEVVAKRPQKTHRFWPTGDNDNYEKATYDAITQSQRFWDDDDQVVINLTTKRYARPNEQFGTRVWIYKLEPHKD